MNNPPADDAQPFELQIAAHPYESSYRLVYADWLEERGQQQAAAEQRRHCEFRMPMTRKELRSLPKIQASVNGTSALTVTIGDVTPPSHFSSTSLLAFESDLASLSTARVAKHFPRDDQGRLNLRTNVLLAHYEAANGRDYFLAARGPERRKDANEIVVSVTDGYVMNQEFDWSWLPQRWTERRRGSEAVANDRALFEGFEDRPLIETGDTLNSLAKLAAFQDDRQRNALEQALEQGALDDNQRVALIIHHLDDGRFEEALKLAGVSFDEGVSRILNGEPFPMPEGCDCRFDSNGVSRRRAYAMRRALWSSAPWRFQQAIQIHASRANARRRRQQPELLYLFILPGQIHAMRTRLTLGHSPQGPHLSLQASGSNVRPWRWTWTRPLELDLRRFAI